MPTIKEQILELDTYDLVRLWNDFCYSTAWNGEIAENNEDTLSVWFDSYQELSRAICYGDFNYMDEFIALDGYGNLLSYNKYNFVEYLDIDELATWCEEKNIFESEEE
jgi:hypothetical protein